MDDRVRLHQQMVSSLEQYTAAKDSEQYVQKMIASYRKRRQLAYMKYLRDLQAWQKHAPFESEGMLPVEDMLDNVQELKAS